jgi:hypothetical protein
VDGYTLWERSNRYESFGGGHFCKLECVLKRGGNPRVGNVETELRYERHGPSLCE